jgi:hypothetical protein
VSEPSCATPSIRNAAAAFDAFQAWMAGQHHRAIDLGNETAQHGEKMPRLRAIDFIAAENISDRIDNDQHRTQAQRFGT